MTESCRYLWSRVSFSCLAPEFANELQQALQYLRFGTRYAPVMCLESRAHRRVKFTTQNIVVHGEIDAIELKQASDRAPKASEGLLEALDLGIL